MSGSVENNTTLNQIEGKVLSVPLIDNTLTKTGRSADAKAVGDQVKRLDERIDNVDPHFAKNVQYDNAKSKLNATEIQGAIDEIQGAIGGINTKLNKDFYGVHNKPTGSYKGDGTTTTREIQVGGNGGWLGVCSGSYMIGFISQNGAVFFNTTNSTVKCFPVSQAQYISGKLIISSADIFLNGDGNTYHYQVL